MAIKRKRTDITSADSKEIGFEYQYLYFIIKLLKLSKGEEVGYEALDDVHTISYQEEETYFYQLKHTIETNDEKQANLGLLSSDFWKTYSNWSKLISDESEGRKLKKDQKEFIGKSYFVFVINRDMSSNDVVLNIEKLKNGVITGKVFFNYLNEVKGKSKNEVIIQYINDVLKLGTSVLENFAKKTIFISAPNNLFNLIREGIKDKMVADEYVDDVFSNLYLQLKKDFFDKVCNGKHQVIKYEEWINKYQSVFNQYRNTQLPIRTFKPVLPKQLEKQNFVEELIEIGVLDKCELAEIAELTEYYLSIELQLNSWYQDGRITYAVLQEFHKDAKLQWKNIHRAAHRLTIRDKRLDLDNAVSCFNNVMMEKLKVTATELGMALSNGEFIKLANENKIGWKYSWKDRYH